VFHGDGAINTLSSKNKHIFATRPRQGRPEVLGAVAAVAR
jgi:hypothetical protein